MEICTVYYLDISNQRIGRRLSVSERSERERIGRKGRGDAMVAKPKTIRKTSVNHEEGGRIVIIVISCLGDRRRTVPAEFDARHGTNNIVRTVKRRLPRLTNAGAG